MLAATRFGTSDIERAKVFYDAITKILGATRVLDKPNVVGYKGAEGTMFMIGQPFEGEATSGNGTMVSIPAASRSVVDQVHAKALELGGKSAGAPGIRNAGAYGAYIRDHDGNKLGVFHTGS
jgi:predicted lactoylglutathione lyase